MNEREPRIEGEGCRGEPRPGTREEETDTPERGDQLGLQPLIWVASLADYNAGRLYGVWIDADQEPDALRTDIQTMLDDSPTLGAEEWAVFDYEDFSSVRLHEHESLESVSRIAVGLVEHGHPFAGWAALAGTSPEQLAKFEEAYLGTWESVEDYAADLLDDLGYTHTLETVLPAHLRLYVRLDVEGFARDLVMAGDVIERPAVGEAGVYLYDGLAF